MNSAAQRAMRLAIIQGVFPLNDDFKYDDINNGSHNIVERMKSDPKRGTLLARLDDKLTSATLKLDDAGEEIENSKIGLSELLTLAIVESSKRTDITTDSIDTALTSIGKLLENPQIKLYMDEVNGIKAGEILTTAVLVQLTAILSSSLPFNGAIGDLGTITSGNGKHKLAVYNMTPIASKGMGDIVDDEVLTPINTLKTFANSTREKNFTVVAGTKVYELDVKAKAADAANAKMERGVNEVILTGIDFDLNDFDENPNATDPTVTYTDSKGATIKVEWKYDDGKIIVTFSDETDYVGEILALIGGLNTDTLDNITPQVMNKIHMEVYVSRVVRLSTQVNLLKIREVLSSIRTNLLSENLAIVDMVFEQGEKGRMVENALRFSKKSTKQADLDITAVGGSTGGYAEQNKAFIVAVKRVATEILTDSQLTAKVCLIGGNELENMFYRLSVGTAKVSERKQKDNSIRLLGTINGVQYIVYPLYDTKYPVAAGYSRVDVVGIPTQVAQRVSQTGVDLPLIPVEISVDKNSDQLIPFEGKLMSSSNKNPNSQKLVKHFLFKQ